VREIVDHGVTGFIVTSEDEAVSAVERASSLDRSEIRRTFERSFTSKVMARNYLALYWSLAHEGDSDLKVAPVG
jgi:glycosyltransferase involved in cell wall biosynthesis